MTNFNNQPAKFYGNYHIDIYTTSEFKSFVQRTQGKEYIWSYKIIIRNCNNFSIQLISRYWRIIHANGYTEEITGDGVVGAQPLIEPNSEYTYTSQVKLYTASGIMLGHYKMRDDRGNHIKVEIDAFSLDSSLEPVSKH